MFWSEQTRTDERIYARTDRSDEKKKKSLHVACIPVFLIPLTMFYMHSHYTKTQEKGMHI